ncbi:hypothetical protein FRC12_019090 [Ceratobasidium sp. 428]|nr:hypothetical protein FRC12_019090 [Ceratobasidium sp. 428]
MNPSPMKPLVPGSLPAAFGVDASYTNGQPVRLLNISLQNLTTLTTLTLLDDRPGCVRVPKPFNVLPHTADLKLLARASYKAVPMFLTLILSFQT